MATEDQDVFEITDFTTASDWERFIASVEEVFHEWKLCNIIKQDILKKSDFSQGKWKETQETIIFSGFRFVITHYLLVDSTNDGSTSVETADEETSQLLVDFMTSDIDFAGVSENLSYWYGLREYVVISPAIGENAIANESRAKLLLSSICIALSNTGCHIPMFVQLHQRDEQFFLGVAEGKGLRTNFQMVHLKRAHQQFSHLSGLLDVFKSKLAFQMSLSAVISISICFTYKLKSWDYNGPWSQLPPDVESNDNELIGSSNLGKLPFGTWVDPIGDILLSALWSNLTEDIIVDNVLSSDLEPAFAPLWRVRIKFEEDIPCLLGKHLQNFRSLTYHNETSEHVLGFKTGEGSNDANAPISHVLDRLTNTVPPIINVPLTLQQKKMPEGPIPENKLKEILFFLFPDATGKDCGNVLYKQDKDEAKDERFQKVKESLQSLKSVPTNGLIYYLAICLCHVNNSYGRVSAVVHLWHEFVLEMRHRWENSLIIPGLEAGVPDISCCLLNQKLQMLNYCIEKKKLRDQQHLKTSNVKEHQNKTDNSSSDEEFYDCDDDRQKEHSDLYLDSSISLQPEGRLRPCGNLTYVESDQVLFIPITQDPPPMTEDQLEAHADVLLKLGTDEEGSQLRAKMQSSCLLSDMQSFKAANPNCKLEDFVRWYSPRDWLEDSGEKGRLSDRMLVPDNMWQSVWNNAKPIPAWRQRRLFDDTKEGEKVLHYLASLTPADLVAELMPVLIHAAIDTLIENDENFQSVVPAALQSIITTASKLPKLTAENGYQYDGIINNLKSVETMLTQYKAFKSLFTWSSQQVDVPVESIASFMKELFENHEAYLMGGVNTNPGKVMNGLLKRSMKAEMNMLNDTSPKSGIPLPSIKEYIFRTVIPRLASYSTPTPQRMYCSLSEEGFRLAGAFTQDTTFQ